MRKYRLVAKKGEGTFSEVLKAQNVKDGRYHAIKCMKNTFDSIDQVNNLREIQALRRLSPNEHVITLEEVLYDQPTGRLALVFELMDANLYEIIRGRRHYLNPQLLKSYIWQLMKSLDHMHKKGIFHRDIKPENILIESGAELGRGLKLADFGSCRGIYSKQPYTEYISTRWYRAPECLLTDGYYGPEMDLWGAGCVMFEITSLVPLFPGSNEADQINRIHSILGTPTKEILTKLKSKGASHINFDFPDQKGTGIPPLVPHTSSDSLDLLIKLLKYDNTERIAAREAMKHPYLKEMRELDAKRTESTTATTGVTAGNTGTGTTSTPRNVVDNSDNISINTSSNTQQQTKKELKSLPNIIGATNESNLKPPPNILLKPVMSNPTIPPPSNMIPTNSSNSLPPIQGKNPNMVQSIGTNSGMNGSMNSLASSGNSSVGGGSTAVKKKKKLRVNNGNNAANEQYRSYVGQRLNNGVNNNVMAIGGSSSSSNISLNGGGNLSYQTQSGRYVMAQNKKM